DHHIENQPPTPYRPAVVQIKRRLEAAKRGEALPLVPNPEGTAAPTVAALGLRAPDFLTTNLLTRESVRLNHLLGRPLLLIFYSPTSQTVEEVLRFGQSIQNAHKHSAMVVALAITDDGDAVQKQHAALRLGYPILSGRALRQSYAVEATPYLVVLDA